MPKGVDFIDDEDVVVPDTPSPVFEKKIIIKNKQAKSKCRLILSEESGSDSDFMIKPAPKKKRFNGSTPPVKGLARMKGAHHSKKTLNHKQSGAKGGDSGGSSHKRGHKKSKFNFVDSSSPEEDSQSEDELLPMKGLPKYLTKKPSQEKEKLVKPKQKVAAAQGSSAEKKGQTKKYLDSDFFDFSSSDKDSMSDDLLSMNEPSKASTKQSTFKSKTTKELKQKGALSEDPEPRSSGKTKRVQKQGDIAFIEGSQSEDELFSTNESLGATSELTGLEGNNEYLNYKEQDAVSKNTENSNEGKRIQKNNFLAALESSSEDELLAKVELPKPAPRVSGFSPKRVNHEKKAHLKRTRPTPAEAAGRPTAVPSQPVDLPSTANPLPRPTRPKRPVPQAARSDISVITLSSDDEPDDLPESSPDMDDDEFDWLIERLGAGSPIMDEPSREPVRGTVTHSAGSAWGRSPPSDRHTNRRHRGATATVTRSSQRGNDFVPASDLLQFRPPQEVCICNVTRTEGSESTPVRRACPCKNTRSEVIAGSNRSPRRPKRKTPSASASRGSASRDVMPGAASGANDSMARAVSVVSQLETDEEMARRMQEDLDHQFAAALASGASATPQPRGLPSSRPMPGAANRSDDIELRISLMTDWEWAVHVALARGEDIPPVPANEFHNSPDEALDPSLLEYLHAHPEVMNRRHISNSRRSGARNQRSVPALPTFLAPTEDSPPAHGRRRPRLPRAAAVGTRRRAQANRALHLNDIEERLLGLLEFEAGLNRFNRRGGFGRMDVPDGNDYEVNLVREKSPRLLSIIHLQELLALEEQLGTVAAKPGLSAEQIGRLPVVTYCADPPSTSDRQCHVCMSDYEQGERLRILTCFHTFHCSCIDQWIKNKPTCPVCRTEVEV